MQISRISYQPQRTQPNFQAKIRIADEATASAIENDICSFPSKNQALSLMDKFDKFQKDKIILIKYLNSNSYHVKNESNNMSLLEQEGLPFPHVLVELMKENTKNYIFWTGKTDLLDHKIFIIE